MTFPDPPMSVCYDCSRCSSGRCWRHRNATLVNASLGPPPVISTVAKYTTISIAELPHFQRLVRFLHEVESLAETRDDDELALMAEMVRDDLADLQAQGWTS